MVLPHTFGYHEKSLFSPLLSIKTNCSSLYSMEEKQLVSK